LLILIGLVVLFVILLGIIPVRYKVEAKHDEYEEDETGDVSVRGWNVKGRISWFLRCISFVVLYNEADGMVYRLKVFGIPFGRKKKNDNNKTTENRHIDDGDENQSDVVSVENTQSGGVSSEDNKQEDVISAEDDVHSDSMLSGDNKQPDIDVKKGKSETAKPTDGIKDSIHKVVDNIKRIWGIVTNPDTKTAAGKVKQYLVKLLKHICPDKIYVNMVIGTGDPCSTGYLFGIFGMIIGMWPGKYQIYPDFEKKIIEGKMRIKGKAYLYVLLCHMIRAFFDEDIRKVIDSNKISNKK